MEKNILFENLFYSEEHSNVFISSKAYPVCWFILLFSQFIQMFIEYLLCGRHCLFPSVRTVYTRRGNAFYI